MSLPALRYIFASDLAGFERLVALELANAHNGQTGACFPGVAELITATGASRSTVLRSLKSLTAAAVVTSSRRPENKNECAYVFPGLPEWLETLGKGGRGSWKTGVTQTPVARKTGVTQTPVRCHTDTDFAQTGVTQTPLPPPPNIRINQEGFNRERTPHGSVRKRASAEESGKDGYGKRAAGRAAGKSATTAAMEAERAERESHLFDNRNANNETNIIPWTNPLLNTEEPQKRNAPQRVKNAAWNTARQ